MIAYPRSLSVDREVEDIRKSLREMHRTLYKWQKAAENVTERVHWPLNEFDSALSEIRNQMANIRKGFFDIVGKFPSQFAWLTFILLLDLLIWTLAFFIIVKIFEGMRKIGHRRRILRGSDEDNEHLVEEGTPRGDNGEKRPFETKSDSEETKNDAQFDAKFDLSPSAQSYEQMPTKTDKFPRSILKAPTSMPKMVQEKTATNRPMTTQINDKKRANEKDEEMRMALLSGREHFGS